MLVCIETPDCILFLKPFLFEHVQNLLLIGYLIVTHNETLIHTHWLIQLKPGVRTDILNFETFLWVCIQDLLKHFLSVSADKAGYLEFSTQNFLIELGCIGVFKGQEAADKGKHDDAAAPNIYICSQIFFASYHFRRGIARTATSCLKELSMAVSITEAKVNYFDVFVMI